MLTVKESITIQAPAARVWEVLITPKYIRQWDELPEGFGEEAMQKGSVVNWEGYSRLTVSEFEPNRLLKMNLHGEKWEKPPSAYDIAYTFGLEQDGQATVLTISIGNFAALPDGKQYFDASVEFATTAKAKIKELAES